MIVVAVVAAGVALVLHKKGNTAAQTVDSVALLQQLQPLVDSLPAEVGIAMMMDNGMTFELNYESQFPMLSVVKFPQAMAVCHKLEETGASLSDKVKVLPTELCRDTWSPMLEQYPQGGEITIGELLEYALVQSDNNACDLLFSHVADVDYTQQYISSIIPEGCSISATEMMMHDDLSRCYNNSCTPVAAVQLLEYFYQHHEDSCSAQVWRLMEQCQTGENRIPCYIRDKVSAVVHKTGTGPVVDGKIIAVNDVACILLPDGRHCNLAVFVKDAQCSPEQCEEFIAQVAKLIIYNL